MVISECGLKQETAERREAGVAQSTQKVVVAGIVSCGHTETKHPKQTQQGNAHVARFTEADTDWVLRHGLKYLASAKEVS